MGAEILPHHAADLVGVGDDAVEVAVLGQPLQCGLGPALGDSGNAIDAVADERQVVHDEPWRHAEFGLHPGRVEEFVAHGVVPAYGGTHQLGQVLVAGGDQRLHADCGRPGGEGADDVVGLDAVDHQQGPAGGPYCRVNGLDLTDQVFRHGRTVGLVFGEPVIAEGLALGVEDHGLVVRLVVAFQPA